jgi:hypothetical protein
MKVSGVENMQENLTNTEEENEAPTYVKRREKEVKLGFKVIIVESFQKTF